MEALQLGQALLQGELKTLQSIAKHLPRQEEPGKVGVDSGTAWQWMKREQLVLPTFYIDGERFFYVPLADQERPDWNLQSKFQNKRAVKGRRSTRELLGFTPKG